MGRKYNIKVFSDKSLNVFSDKSIKIDTDYIYQLGDQLDIIYYQNETNDQCNICTDIKHVIGKTKCSHIFCQSCIEKWHKKSHDRCFTCKKLIIKK